MFTLFNVHYSVLPMFICQALALNPSFSVCKSFPASQLDARPGSSIIFSTPSSSSSSTNRPRLCITQPLSTSFSSFHPESPFPTHPLRFNWNANPTLCCTSKDPFSQRKYRRHTVLSINIVATKQVQGISSGSVYSLISGHLILPTRATDVREVWFHVVVIVLNFVTGAADQDEHSLQMDCIRPQ